MRFLSTFALVTCLALAACASPREPVTNLPAAYQAPPSAGLDEAVLDQWWLAFEDPQLTALVEQALVLSPDAQSAAARLREARATAASALTAFLPQGQLTGSARRTETEQVEGQEINIPGLSTSGESESYQANFNVSWELDLFGRFFAARRAARGDSAAARFAYEGARASLAANVADAYFQARGLAIQLADARETLRIQESLGDLAERRVELGIAASSDADRIAGDLAQARAQVANLEAQLQAQQRILLVLVGRGVDPVQSVDVEAAPGLVPPVPASLPGGKSSMKNINIYPPVSPAGGKSLKTQAVHFVIILCPVCAVA